MKLVRWVLISATALGVAACSSGPVKRINPPTASIQELAVLPDGSWSLTLRVQNFSTVPMTFSAISGSLRVDGAEAGDLNLSSDLDVVGERAETVRTTLRPKAPLAAGRNVSYALKGRIEARAPKSQSFEFDHSSQLSPVPGVPNTWR